MRYSVAMPCHSQLYWRMINNDDVNVNWIFGLIVCNVLAKFNLCVKWCVTILTTIYLFNVIRSSQLATRNNNRRHDKFSSWKNTFSLSKVWINSIMITISLQNESIYAFMYHTYDHLVPYHVIVCNDFYVHLIEFLVFSGFFFFFSN